MAHRRPATIRQESAFLNRQRELQSLHRQLHSVLEDMNQLNPVIEEKFGLDDEVSEEEEDVSDVACLSNPGISAEQDIRLLIHEIQQLQHDVLSIQSALLSRCKGRYRDRVHDMIGQLGGLHHILDGQLYRADRLLHLPGE